MLRKIKCIDLINAFTYDWQIVIQVPLSSIYGKGSGERRFWKFVPTIYVLSKASLAEEW